MKNSNLIQAILFTLVAGLVSANANADSGADLYKSECSACHIAYPPAFLTSASWDAVLAHLDDHFGDNAELAAQELASIKQYVEKNSFDHSRIKRRYGNRFDTPGTPLRVTKTRFFRAIHDEVPDRLVTGNPAVKTFARCEVCHRGAQYGSFDEDEVRIPR